MKPKFNWLIVPCCFLFFLVVIFGHAWQEQKNKTQHYIDEASCWENECHYMKNSRDSAIASCKKKNKVNYTWNRKTYYKLSKKLQKALKPQIFERKIKVMATDALYAVSPSPALPAQQEDTLLQSLSRFAK